MPRTPHRSLTKLTAAGLLGGLTAGLAAPAASGVVLGYSITNITFNGLAEEGVLPTEDALTVIIDDQAPPARFSLDDGQMNTFDGAFIYTPEIDVDDDPGIDDLNPSQTLTVDIDFAFPLGAGSVQLTGRTIGLITLQDTLIGPAPFERGVVEFDAPVVVNLPGVGQFQVEGIDTEFNRGTALPLGPGLTGLTDDTSGVEFGAFVPIKITQLNSVPEPSALLLFGPALLALTARGRRALAS